jgi:hypothetical protein
MEGMTDRESIVLERRITWGGLLTIATILVTAGINWGIASKAAEATATEVALVKGDVEALKNARFQDNTRMVRIETLVTEILEEVKARR